MKDLSFVTELTTNEQEKVSGGTGFNSNLGSHDFFVIDGGGEIVSQCGDVARTPNGTLIRDNNCTDDPLVGW